MESKKNSRFYIINHMDDFLYEWSLSEYLQMDKYFREGKTSASLVLSNADTFLNYKDSNPRNSELNNKNVDILKKANTNFHFLPKDINSYINATQSTLEIPSLPHETSLPFPRICLLDMRAKEALTPSDASLFDAVLFGGILGDHPPRDRTSALRNKGYAIRHLGSLQLATDTAVLVTSLILEKGKKLEEIAFVEEPEVQGKENKGVRESVQIEGFRYVDKGIDLVTGDVKEKTGSPLMSENIRKNLIFKELDINDFF